MCIRDSPRGVGGDRRKVPGIHAGPGRVREDGGRGRAARVPLSGPCALDVAVAAAREAGEVLVGHFGRLDPALVEEKALNDVVSIADRESEAVIRRVVLGAFPSDRFLGEETGLSGADETAPSWIVDPLDGTANFVRGRVENRLARAASGRRRTLDREQSSDEVIAAHSLK